MIYNKVLFVWIGFFVISLQAVDVDKFFIDGYHLGRYFPSDTDTLTLKNASSTDSVFITSSLQHGYQYEITAGQSVNANTCGRERTEVFECQNPFGFPTKCVMQCKPPKGKRSGNTECTAGAVLPTYGTSKKTQCMAPKDPAELKYVFLDTVINKSKSTFIIATTTAPLYGEVEDPATGQQIVDPNNSIAGALDAGKLDLFGDIYKKKAITFGATNHPVTFLIDIETNPDGRFTFPPGITKKHMASARLALGTDIGKGVQTIMLFPQDISTSCQPIIFIGRDVDTNKFYALTYLSNHVAQNVTLCCVDAAGNRCTHDTLYNKVAADKDIILGGQARLRLTIGQNQELGDYGFAEKLEAEPGLWWPGKVDFTVTTT